MDELFFVIFYDLVILGVSTHNKKKAELESFLLFFIPLVRFSQNANAVA